jgi:hypothetical protein
MQLQTIMAKIVSFNRNIGNASFSICGNTVPQVCRREGCAQQPACSGALGKFPANFKAAICYVSTFLFPFSPSLLTSPRVSHREQHICAEM